MQNLELKALERPGEQRVAELERELQEQKRLNATLTQQLELQNGQKAEIQRGIEQHQELLDKIAALEAQLISKTQQIESAERRAALAQNEAKQAAASVHEAELLRADNQTLQKQLDSLRAERLQVLKQNQTF